MNYRLTTPGDVIIECDSLDELRDELDRLDRIVDADEQIQLLQRTQLEVTALRRHMETRLDELRAEIKVLKLDLVKAFETTKEREARQARVLYGAMTPQPAARRKAKERKR